MLVSHWGKKIIEEKHSSAMRWVTTTLEETDSRIIVERLLESDVLPSLTSNFFIYNLKGTSFPDAKIEMLDLPLDALSRQLRLAYEQTYSYLIAPEAFLADFLATIEGVTLDETFSSKLRIFTDYDYFPALLAAWAGHSRDKGRGFVSRTDFIVKLRDIDTLILRHATISVLVDLLDPLYNFHRHLSSNPALPGTELALFFADKGVSAAVEAFGKQDEREFDLKQAVEVISGMIGAGVATIEISKPPTERQSEYPETHYDSFLQDLHEAGVEIRSPDESPRRLPPIELFIAPKLRQRAIDEVFRKRTDEYERFVDHLNGSKSINRALLNLETTLQLHRIDPGSKVARRLREAISMRFHGYAA